MSSRKVIKKWEIKEAIRSVDAEFPFTDYVTRSATTGNLFSVVSSVVKSLVVGSSILDIGCGPCNTTAVLSKLGYVCTGYDDLNDKWHLVDGNRQKIIDFAKDSGVSLILNDGSPWPFAPEFFDMVMLHDILEHLHDSPREMLNTAVRSLKTHGTLYITVPNAVNIRKRLRVAVGKSNMPKFEHYFRSPGHWRGHVREYVKEDLIQLAEFMHLEIVEVKGCTHMLDVVPRKLQLLYRIFTWIFANCQDSWSLTARKPLDWIPGKEYTEEELKSMSSSPTRVVRF